MPEQSWVILLFLQQQQKRLKQKTWKRDLKKKSSLLFSRAMSCIICSSIIPLLALLFWAKSKKGSKTSSSAVLLVCPYSNIFKRELCVSHPSCSRPIFCSLALFYTSSSVLFAALLQYKVYWISDYARWLIWVHFINLTPLSYLWWSWCKISIHLIQFTTNQLKHCSSCFFLHCIVWKLLLFFRISAMDKTP